jgi:hypothetical protein
MYQEGNKLVSSKVIKVVHEELGQRGQLNMQDLYAQIPACIDHGLQVTHICCEKGCTYSFLCSQCLVSNEKHLLQHQKEIKRWGYFDLKIEENLGLGIISRIGSLKGQLDSLEGGLPEDIDFLRGDIEDTFRRAEDRLAAELEQLKAQFLARLEDEVEETRQFVSQKKMELIKLEELVNKASNLKRD